MIDPAYPHHDDPPAFAAWLLDRLSDVPDVTWNPSINPTHSSYDEWHLWGERHSSGASSPQNHPLSPARPVSKHNSRPATPRRTSTDPQISTRPTLIARISRANLRIERQYQMARALGTEPDRRGKYHFRALQLLRLPPRNEREPYLTVILYENPGYNDCREWMNFGPNWYQLSFDKGLITWSPDHSSTVSGKSAGNIEVPDFIEFAIGASDCLEMLHQKAKLVHGELRPDSLHYNRKTHAVKLLNLGSGARSIESSLTSGGWSTLTREKGVEWRLQFVAPEQTGRVQANTDARTDLYSMGIIFWLLLTGFLPFAGKSPMEVIQDVLNRKVPPISTKRSDVPDALSDVIQKLVSKSIDDRYHSAAGLRWDLNRIQQLLVDGDREGLNAFVVGSRDFNSFFTLPDIQIGREDEKKSILDAIERVWAGKRRASPSTGTATTGSESVTSDPRNDVAIQDGDTASDSTSNHSRAHNGPPSVLSGPARLAGHPSYNSDGEEVSSQSSAFGLRPSLDHRLSNEFGYLSINGSNGPDLATRSLTTSGFTDNPEIILRTAQRFKRKTRCELVTIMGAAGLGKSNLISSVLAHARTKGYTASAKFDQVKATPFAPCLRLLSSVIQQVFSESNVNTDFHDSLRSFMRPIWHFLSNMLGLPDRLLDRAQGNKPTIGNNSVPSSPTHNTRDVHSKSQQGIVGRNTADFFRYGTSAKSSRFIAVYLDVLRFISSYKFVMFCLEDIQSADEESLNLVDALMAARIPLLLILTIREESGPRIRSLLTKRNVNITKLELKPLTEDQIGSYVSTTLRRSRDYCFSLVAVLSEKTRGNPFFLREMLETCYRTHCLWYSFKDAEWVYDLDKIFKEFESQAYGSQITNDSITKRILALSPSAIQLLKWASLLGSCFSFKAVKTLLEQENLSARDEHINGTSRALHSNGKADLVRHSSQDAVRALQETLSAYIIETDDENEDRMRWVHERFLQSARSLCEDVEEKHFQIAKLMVRSDDSIESCVYTKAYHISSAAKTIKNRVETRAPYRKALFSAAERATESGGRAAGLEYFSACLMLLQNAPSPWDDSRPDVDYQETLHCYTRAAESYWHHGYTEPALALLHQVFENAHDAVDRVPAYVLHSRIQTRRGDSVASFKTLKKCLSELELEVPETTWEECDRKFEDLCSKLKKTDPQSLLEQPLIDDRRLTMLGSVLCDAIAAAFWTDTLLYYQLALLEVELHLTGNTTTQAGLAYVHLGSCAIGRFGQVAFGCELGSLALRLFERFSFDKYTCGRGNTLYCLLIGHLSAPIETMLTQMSQALEMSLSAGDSVSALINVGFSASFRFWSSYDCSEIEAFCAYGPEELVNWHEDVRGGLYIITLRQLSRALQGKTNSRDPLAVFNDRDHNTSAYLEYVTSKSTRPQRSIGLYDSFRLVALYTFGYYKEALALGESTLAVLSEQWSSRVTVMVPFYLTLAGLEVLREDPTNSARETILTRARQCREKLQAWTAVSEANYIVWLHLVTALLNELDGEIGGSVRKYEEAQDCAELASLHLDYGLASELAGQFLIRRGAKRLARTALNEAIAAYRRVSAFAKATQIVEKYEYLLKGTSSLHVSDAACQTMENDSSLTNILVSQEVHERRSTVHNQEPFPSSDSLGLDVLDLQSILSSSQVLASELDLSKLLASMSRIILESVGAVVCGIVLQNEFGEWTIVYVDDMSGKEWAQDIPLDQAENSICAQITINALRFKETIFVPNIFEQTRFPIPNGEKAVLAVASSRAVIVMPILRGDDGVLGAVYVEGRAFSEKSTTLMRLLVNSFSTSITNSKLFKQVEKVSANNAVMVDSQKHALAQARKAEQKAKLAEAEAMRSVKLKEEAARAKSMFLANVSHELRTPLNGVIGMSELLKGSELSTEQEGYADSIRVCADTLLTVINDILDYSKLEAGKMQMFSVELSLYETIHEVVRALSYSNMEKHLETIVKLDLDPNALVMGDPVRLHQILMNLMSNSYKFTAEGSVTVNAVVDKETDTDVQVTCSVEDTGVGISEEQKKKLFLPFSQADSSTARSYGGTGLGLSICKAIIENVMKGKIWLESAPGKGTKVFFTLTFPKAEGHTATSVRPALRPKDTDPMAIYSPTEENGVPDTPPGSTSIDLSAIPRDKISVLCAEDNPINQKIAISFVKKLGFKCEAFPDGRQAVDALHRASKEGRPYHIVLMDVQMPVLDGYDATREIRRSTDPAVRDVLVIAMTASAIRGDRERCLKSGMNSYLPKPVRQQVLKEMLERYISGSAKSTEPQQ